MALGAEAFAAVRCIAGEVKFAVVTTGVDLQLIGCQGRETAFVTLVDTTFLL